MTKDRTISFNCIPKTSPLFLDYLYHFSKVQPFFSSWYSLDFFKRENVSGSPIEMGHRLRLCEILQDQNKSYGAGTRTLENLGRLKDKDCFAVVTGQQVGLFTGPAYTIYKALTAVKLAAHYACRGVKAVPIFWMATEDHDIAEVDHCALLDGDSVPLHVQYETGPQDSHKPVGKVVFSSSIEPPLARFLEALPNSEFKQEIAAKLADSYKPGNTFGSAFGQMMSYLFSNYGLILIDPQDERLKHLGKPVFERVLLSSQECHTLLADRNRRLIASGYHAQVLVEEDATLLFLEENARRKALVRENGQLKTKGSDQHFTIEELSLLIRQSPQKLSPNVLLRPVIQDFLLPTLAYVAGPSEIAYLAQVAPLYEVLGKKMPIIFPRSSFSIIEKKISKVLERYQLRFCDLFQGSEAVMKMIIEKTLDQTVAQKFEQIEEEFKRRLGELEMPLKKVDQTLVDALKTTQQKVQYQIAHLRTKLVHAEAKHNEIVTRQVEKTLAILYPLKSLQERQINIFYFLSRYGMDFLAQLYEEVDLSDPDHRLLYF
jgi:bacillithiol biosynthesis cysteine-adding enzyme BshC